MPLSPMRRHMALFGVAGIAVAASLQGVEHEDRLFLVYTPDFTVSAPLMDSSSSSESSASSSSSTQLSSSSSSSSKCRGKGCLPP